MVSGHLAVKKNRWYAILCLRHPDGRRYDKWIATGLSYPGNKRKAEAMLIELRRQYFVLLIANIVVRRVQSRHLATNFAAVGDINIDST